MTTIPRNLVAFLLLTLMAAVLFCGCSTGAALQNDVESLFDDKYVSTVKQGYLQMAPNRAIGEAFGNFFGNPKWRSFESTDHQRVVEFTGQCTWDNKPADCKMQFVFKDETEFETGAVSINGTDLNVLQTAVIMAKIMGTGSSGGAAETADTSTSVHPDTSQPSGASNQAEPAANPPAPVAVPPGESAAPPVPDFSHWIEDSRTGVYLWNPEPAEGESIVWSGGFVTDGNIRYAEGSGVVTWYRNGEVIQIDEGGFSHGRHHGHFSHKFPSGRIIYSNWDHGREIE